jgi:hypothetical protein
MFESFQVFASAEADDASVEGLQRAVVVPVAVVAGEPCAAHGSDFAQVGPTDGLAVCTGKAHRCHGAPMIARRLAADSSVPRNA